jgi:Tfp pilus assembly protein PilF
MFYNSLKNVFSHMCLGLFALASDKAATDLQAACGSATTNTPFLNLAEIEAARGSHQLAIQLASKAIEIDPTDYSAYATRAGIYQEAGLHGEAETDRATVQKLRR